MKKYFSTHFLIYSGTISFLFIILIFTNNCSVSQFTTANNKSGMPDTITFTDSPKNPSATSGVGLANPAGQELYSQHCASCHGSYNNSAKFGKSLIEIQNAIKSIPFMKSLQSLDIDTLQKIANALKKADLPPEIISQPGDLKNPYICQSSQDPGFSDLKRLSKFEYLNSIKSIFNIDISQSPFQQAAQGIPDNSIQTLFTTSDNSLSLNHLEGFLDFSSLVADEILKNTSSWASLLGCTEANLKSDLCWSGFQNSIAKLIYRRSLKSTEIEELKAILNTSDLSGPEAWKSIIELMLNSNTFLYKLEIEGSSIQSRSDLFQLSQTELASKLAFSITGQGPNLQLIQDAESNLLADENFYNTTVKKLFNTEESKNHISHFYQEWLSIDRIPIPSQPNWFLQNISPQLLRNEAQQELKDFVKYYTLQTTGTYKDLFLSEKSFVAGPSLASIYGVESTFTTAPSTSNIMTQLNLSTATKSAGRAEGNGWNLTSNGKISFPFTFKSSKKYELSIVARSQLLSQMGAEAKLYMDTNQILNSFTVSNTTANEFKFNYTTSATTSGSSFSVEFINDAYNATTGEDRNLIIDSVKITEINLIDNSVTNTNMTQKEALLPSGERPGLLSRTGVLLSQGTSASLVHRGLLVRRNFLCQPIPAPDFSKIDPNLLTPAVSNPLSSLREQIEQRTSSVTCMGCHSLLNPMGFVLEKYDSIGRSRNKELVYDSQGKLIAEHPLNLTIHPNINSTQDPDVTGLKNLSENIVSSSRGPACFAEQWYVFSKGRSLTAADSCSMNFLYESLVNDKFQNNSAEKSATLIHMFKALPFEPHFKFKKIKTE